MSYSLEQFLQKNRIDLETWEKANIEWDILEQIANDHKFESTNLENAAELIAKVIQKFEKVHSVRWRVKDSDHLLEKIVRKRAEGNEKYADITLANYIECVTDLVGVRALHLFKENCFEINAALKSVWSPIENPVAYIREGDSENLKTRFKNEGFEVRNHPAGYRSVHYVIESIPLRRKIRAEIQVRTIFEEGWSEIDHKVRYPNFSEDKLVEYFLEIFNRMAGSADDMGGFVLGLVSTLRQFEEEIATTRNEKEATFKDMEKTLNQLESIKAEDRASKEMIAKLRVEITKLKEANNESKGLFSLGAASPVRHGLLNVGGTLGEALQNSVAGQAQRGLQAPLNPSGLFHSGLMNQDQLGLLRTIQEPSTTEQAKRGIHLKNKDE